MPEPASAVSRLWFRLDEVIPLAEHAMACRPHPTRAQILAGQRLLPGLGLHRASGTATLSSNGAPPWHDRRGVNHHATALTWQPTGGRRRCDPTCDAFLPLHPGQDDDPPMIDLLRAARHRRQHWLAVDVDPVRGHLITTDTVSFTDHRDEPAPADAAWTAKAVTSHALAHHSYPALITTNYRHDGAPLARFDRRTVERMVADLRAVWACQDRNHDPMPGEYPVLRFDGDVLIAYDTYDDVDESHDTTGIYDRPDLLAGVGLTECDRYRPDRDGFYPVGAFLWAWYPTDAAMPLTVRLRLTRTALLNRLRARHRRSR